MTAYSKTPLARKLTLKNGFRVFWHAMPQTVEKEIQQADLDLDIGGRDRLIDAAHIFVTEAATLETMLAELRHRIE